MQDELTKAEKVALWWVSMDYESLDTIIGNVSEDMGNSISPGELHTILSSLLSKGLVESYIYSPQHQKYILQAPVGTYPQADLSWLISKKGKEFLDNSEND